MAFCRWLSRRLDFTVRLPDEWEWQQAATAGDDKNVFPWGADWDAKQESWRANTFESRLGGVTAVGMYPAGVSSTGALDMAGTVWEWCLNKFDTPEELGRMLMTSITVCCAAGPGSTIRALARSAIRIWYAPVNRDFVIGFRVVCSSPSMSTDP